MNIRRLAPMVACCLLVTSPILSAAPEEGRWAASPDLVTSPNGGASDVAGFWLAQLGAKLTITLEYRGRVITTDLPAKNAAFVIPLNGQARLQDPWVTIEQLETRKSLATLGWNLWSRRPTSVQAAASGVVRSVGTDPSFGPSVEIDHGSGLRTRYFLNRYGTTGVAPGTRVSAGDVIGELGRGLSDDIPFVHFEILLDAGQGELVVLDPAPFFFVSATNRALPFAGSVLNAAVRAKDPAKVSRLISLGIDPNRKAVDTTCSLEWAVMGRDAEMARLLVASGGDPKARTAERTGYYMAGIGMSIANNGPTILEFAEESDDPELIAAVAGK